MTQYPLVKFSDVVRQVKDKVDPQTAGLERFVAGEHMDTDNLHIRRWGDVGAGYLGPAFHMRFKPGQVLYGSRRTYLRKIAVADFEGITANTTYVIEPKDPEVLLPDFLPFVMSTERFHEHSIKQSKGSVNPYINFSDITWYEFPLPPVDEQRRIADLLWAVDGAVMEHTNSLESLDILQKAYTTDLFNPYTKYISGNVNHKDYVGKWRISPLGEECSLIQDGTHLPPKRVESGPWLLGVTNMIDGEFLLTDSDTHVSDDFFFEMHKKWQLIPGDVLLAIVGATIGKTAIVPANFPKFTIQRSVAVLRGNPEKIRNEYLRAYLSSPFGQRELWRRVHQTAQPGLYLKDLRSILVPVPTLEEQNDIVNKINLMKSSVEAIKKQILLLDNIKKNILSKIDSDN